MISHSHEPCLTFRHSACGTTRKVDEASNTRSLIAADVVDTQTTLSSYIPGRGALTKKYHPI